MVDRNSSNPLSVRYLIEDDASGGDVCAYDLLVALTARRLDATRRIRPLSGGDWRSLAEDPDLGRAVRVVMADTRGHWSAGGRWRGLLRASAALALPLLSLLLMVYLRVPGRRFLASWPIYLPLIVGQYAALAGLYHFWSSYLPGHRRGGAHFWLLLPYVNALALWGYYTDLVKRLGGRRLALTIASACCCGSLALFSGVFLLSSASFGGGCWVLGTNALFVSCLLVFNGLMLRAVAARAADLDAHSPLPDEPLQLGDDDDRMTHAWHAGMGRRLGLRLLATLCALPLFLLLLLVPPWYGGVRRWRRLQEQHPGIPLQLQAFAELPMPPEPHAGQRLIRIGIPDFDLGLANHYYLLHADAIDEVDPQWLDKAKTSYDRCLPRLTAFRALLREAPHLGLLRPALGVVRQGRDSATLAITKSRQYGHWRLFAFRFARQLGLVEDGMAEALWEDYRRIGDYEQDDLTRPLAVAVAISSRRLSLLQTVLPEMPEETLPALLPSFAEDERRISEAAQWQCLAENALYTEMYSALVRAGWEKASLFGLDHGSRAELSSFYLRLSAMLRGDLHETQGEILALQHRASQYGGMNFSVAQQSAGFMELARQTALTRLNSRLAHVAVAIERYQRRHGELPANLAALPKDLIAALPPNPFDGSELQYEKGTVQVTVCDLRIDENGVRSQPRRDRVPGARLWAAGDDGAEHGINFF